MIIFLSLQGFAQVPPELINPYFGPQQLLDIGFLNETHGYLVGPDSTSKSTDGGITWFEDPALPEAKRIEIQGEVIGLMGDTELILSSNGGETWNVAYSAPERGYITGFCIAPDQTILT